MGCSKTNGDGLIFADGELKGAVKRVGVGSDVGYVRLENADEADSKGLQFTSVHLLPSRISRTAHVNHPLNSAKRGSNGLSDDGDLFEETSFADQDVQQGLVDGNELDRGKKILLV